MALQIVRPANIVPLICFSSDKMLQGRLLAYADAQRYRVGTHHEALPVNHPRSPVHTYHADGAMRLNVPARTDAYYETRRTRSEDRVLTAGSRSRRCR